ncbi:FAD-binding protein [Bradyrhizobium sp. Gha]|uniref:FAD-binding protein n=1 Tax=Bradyrhizobium sp. Gha TaxID=1855318 RepID=UPI001FCDA97F|nr:FAD-binding protein [Bradyrhizobium sp. Gha]
MAQPRRGAQRAPEADLTGDYSLDCDLLVVGSGAGGLAAALTGACLGLDVIPIEKEARLSGTAAWSDGWMWIPRIPLSKAAEWSRLPSSGTRSAARARGRLRPEPGQVLPRAGPAHGRALRA